VKLDGAAAFVALADNGSISEAARQLRFSKSAVSERLLELERALGTSLMQRNSRQLALTDDGGPEQRGATVYRAFMIVR